MFKKTMTNCCLMIGLLANVAVADVIDGEELADPTRPFFVGASSSGDDFIVDMIRNVVPASFNVSFVRVGSSSSIAIVNDERVSIGDAIGGAIVKSIDRSGVILVVGEQEQRVNLYDNTIKTRAVAQ